ncbi:MAG: thermonuclease family protein [Rhodobacterales bacterium]|nr:thermonuclease family protein [Rhodobacterales bacterium]
MRRVAISLAAALAVAACVEAPAPQAAADPECRVTEVLDGDTFAMSCKGGPAENMRLIGIDAPEVAGALCPAERGKGQEGRRRLQALVAAGPVTAVQYGSTTSDGRRQVRLEVDGQDVSQAMLASGLAKPFNGKDYPDWCGS